MANVYDKGDKIEVTASFSSRISGAPVDPATVTCKVKNPAGTITTYVYGTDPEVVRDSQGNFHCKIDANSAGTWYYRFSSTGDYQAAAEGEFVVKAGQFG